MQSTKLHGKVRHIISEHSFKYYFIPFFFYRIAIEMVTQKIQNKTISQKKNSFLDVYLSNPALDKKDIVGMACDMLLAGIDTVCIFI